jgi:hypothetical protein
MRPFITVSRRMDHAVEFACALSRRSRAAAPFTIYFIRKIYIGPENTVRCCHARKAGMFKGKSAPQGRFFLGEDERVGVVDIQECVLSICIPQRSPWISWVERATVTNGLEIKLRA